MREVGMTSRKGSRWQDRPRFNTSPTRVKRSAPPISVPTPLSRRRVGLPVAILLARPRGEPPPPGACSGYPERLLGLPPTRRPGGGGEPFERIGPIRPDRSRRIRTQADARPSLPSRFRDDALSADYPAGSPSSRTNAPRRASAQGQVRGRRKVMRRAWETILPATWKSR